MANIQWNSSSIQSFFNTSLNRKNTSSFDNMYNLLSDSALIKSGSYYKIMDSYISELKKQQSSESTTTSETTDQDSTNKKLTQEELAAALDEAAKNSKYASYNSSGTKTQSTESILDQLI